MTHPSIPSPGRAARSNPANRYDRLSVERSEQDWPGDGELPPPLRTEVRVETPRKVITRNTSPDVPFDRSLNPYRGCEHGCIYCFARPTHAWLGMSPGLDFETRLIARPGAAEALARELARPGYRVAPLAIGTNTDPYQPVEGEWRVMRRVLEVLAAHRHPVQIVTKGTLIERDLGLLREMAAERLVQVGISVTTLDRKVSRAMEPRVPGPAQRLRTMERLASAGVPVRVMCSPVVPALTDHEMEAILKAGARAGARAASYIVLRLPLEVAELFRDWVEAAFPDRAARILNRVRDLHGGQDYDPAWGKRMSGQGKWAELFRQRFHLARRRVGLAQDLPALRSDLFAVPPKAGDQLSLF